MERAAFNHFTKNICLLKTFPYLRMKINIGGCVNTLSEECKDFYHKYSGDGRNYTARKVRSGPGRICYNIYVLFHIMNACKYLVMYSAFESIEDNAA